MQSREEFSLQSRLLGSRIRQARDRLGLSQEELATLVSKDQRSVSEYETGKRRLSAIDLPRFAEALQVPIVFFFEGQIHQDDIDYAMLAQLKRLPTPESKQAAIDLVRTLADTLDLHLG